jgi:hypothetical protein
MPTHPMYRAARAVVFATVCVGLAITGHMMVSGAAVPPLAAAGGLLALTVVGAALAGAERSLATILAGLLGGQFMLHALFTAAQHGQHLMHGHPMSPSSGDTAMTAVHVAAAVVSAWWLRRGERAVWGLAKRIASGVVRRVVLPSPPRVSTPPSPLVTAIGAVRPRETFLRHVVVRRGPPAPFPAL